MHFSGFLHSHTNCITTIHVYMYTCTCILWQQVFTVVLYLQLLIEHEDAIAPDPSDPLRDILRDLGPSPSVEGLLGTPTACIHIHVYIVHCTAAAADVHVHVVQYIHVHSTCVYSYV